MKHIHFDPICPRCKKLQVEGDCEHELGDLPYWMNKARFKDLEAMMGDNEDDINRELR
jgi:hypothetical protein